VHGQGLPQRLRSPATIAAWVGGGAALEAAAPSNARGLTHAPCASPCAVTDEMNEDLVKMRQATAKVMASERQMNAKYTQAQATADEWLRRAELAVRKGQDDLAREALSRRKGADAAAASLKTQLDAQRRALEQLTANVRALEGKVTEARNKVRAHGMWLPPSCLPLAHPALQPGSLGEVPLAWCFVLAHTPPGRRQLWLPQLWPPCLPPPRRPPPHQQRRPRPPFAPPPPTHHHSVRHSSRALPRPRAASRCRRWWQACV
jgi:hypothetical protein